MRQKTSTKNIDMTTGDPIRLVLAFSVPLIVGNVLQQVYSMVDAAIVGNFVGVNALAAVGCTSWVVWLLLAFCRDCSTAFCIAASQRVGAKNYRGFKTIVANAMTVGILFSLILTAALILANDSILRLMNVPENIFEEARIYLLIYVSAAPFIMVYNMAGSMLRAAGNSSISLLAMIVSTIVNICLDLVFVVMLKWGVAGAGAATFLAQIAAAVIVTWGIWGKEPYHTLPENRRFDGKICREVWRLSLPMFWSSLVIAAGGTFVQKSINGMGSSFTAGIAAGGKLFNILEAIIMAIQAGACIYVGQNLGAGQIERIRKGLRRVIASAMVLTVLMIIIVWSFDSGMVSVFLSKKEEDVYLMALNVGSRYIRCLSVGMLVMTPMYLYRAAIQSLGHTNIPMVVGFCQFLTRVFAIGVLATFWSGAYFWTNVLAWAVSLPIVMVSYAYYIKDLQVKG